MIFLPFSKNLKIFSHFSGYSIVVSPYIRYNHNIDSLLNLDGHEYIRAIILSSYVKYPLFQSYYELVKYENYSQEEFQKLSNRLRFNA